MTKCIFAVLGILMIGTGVAFNAMAGLGNDPVGIFYDGIRSILGLSEDGLGMASNIVNVMLLVILFLLGRHYVNLGTLIYILPYGSCVSLGTWLYTRIFISTQLWCRICGCVAGCLLLYAGVGIYIAMDIGMDPMTGITMVLRDRLRWDYKRAKWLFDGAVTISGFLMGGTLGVITVVTALSAGPCIQYIAEKITGIVAVHK